MTGRVARIAVVLPVYNGEKYVGEAVRSVLDQTFADFELVVVDDGSTDRTAEILDGFSDARLRVLRFPENRGIVPALNAGIRASDSEFIARMDADDICLPQRFERQVAFLEAHPEVALCGSYSRQFGDENDLLRPPVDSARIRARLFFGLAIDHPAVMMRRGFLERHGLAYDESFPHSEDYDLFIRIGQLGDLANVPEALIRTRAHCEEASVVHAQDQARETARLHSRQLRSLMPDVSAEEEAFHLQFLGGTLEVTDVGRVEQWLLRLSRANLAAGCFDPSAFDAELRRKWSHFHHQTSTNGLPVLISYWRSPMADSLASGLRDHLALVLKCLIAAPLRWRRALRRSLANRTAKLRQGA